jgi:hypothetical protein
LPSAALWASSAEELFFIWDSEKSADFSESPFSRKGAVTGGGPPGRYFSAKNGKKIASFVCFLYNTGKIN